MIWCSTGISLLPGFYPEFGPGYRCLWCKGPQGGDQTGPMLLLRPHRLGHYNLISRFDLLADKPILSQLIQGCPDIDQHNGADQNNPAHQDWVLLKHLGYGSGICQAARFKHKGLDLTSARAAGIVTDLAQCVDQRRTARATRAATGKDFQPVGAS